MLAQLTPALILAAVLIFMIICVALWGRFKPRALGYTDLGRCYFCGGKLKAEGPTRVCQGCGQVYYVVGEDDE